MAQVSFSPDATPPPIDRSLEEAGALALTRDKPLRFRIQPDLYNYEKAGYSTWAGLVWMADLEDVEEGRRLREGLTAFFKLFGSDDQHQLLQALQAMEAEYLR